MTLDPQIAEMHQASAGSPPLSALGVEKVRELSTAGDPVSQIHIPHVEEIFVDAGTHLIPCKIYSVHQKAQATVVYVHGGGWVLGGLDTSDDVCRALAHSGDVRVVNVDYRLAPEHPFPAGLNDVRTVFQWVAEQFPESVIGLAGDSAGGNLATVVAQEFGDQVQGLSLIHPSLDMSFSYPSYNDEKTSRPVSLADMQWFRSLYAPETSPHDPALSPGLQSFQGSNHPTTYVLTVQYCPLRDEGRHYVEKLTAANIPVTYEHAMDMCHGFLRLADRVDTARLWRTRVVQQTLATLGIHT